MREGLHGSTRASRIDGALESLELLQGGQEPLYHDWDSLFYVTWYQPRQVHLVYALLRQCYPRGLPERLHVIDIGCGAGAVKLALAILIATDYRARGALNVGVQGIDPSGSMRRLGGELWLSFSCAARRRGLGRLEETIGAMTRTEDTYKGFGAYAESPAAREAEAATCWLTSVHAVYESTHRQLKEQMRRVRASRRPDWELVTTHRSKSHELAAVVSNGESLAVEPRPVWAGCLPQTTAWRRRLARVFSSLSDKSRAYLSKPVTWNPQTNPIGKDEVRVRRRQE